MQPFKITLFAFAALVFSTVPPALLVTDTTDSLLQYKFLD